MEVFTLGEVTTEMWLTMAGLGLVSLVITLGLLWIGKKIFVAIGDDFFDIDSPFMRGLIRNPRVRDEIRMRRAKAPDHPPEWLNDPRNDEGDWN